MQHSKSSTNLNRRGFSLIELLVVLLLISIVTASVSIRWADVYQRAKLQSVLEKLIDVDFKARRHAANRNRPCQLVFDFDAQTVGSSRWVDGAEKFVMSTLPQGIRFTGIRTIGDSVSSGKESVSIFNIGATPTYALEVSQNEQTRWIVFAGRTGQAKVFEDAKKVDEVFKSLRIDGVSQ